MIAATARNGAVWLWPGRPVVFLGVAKQRLRRISQSCWLLVAASAGLASGHPPAAPTQAQVARRFLGEILRADYPAAYHRLVPEMRATLQLAAFAQTAQQLQQLGQQRGRAVELYTLGTHLSERGGHEPWFYRFSFANDSLQKPPPVLLEVTFRDTTTRQVLGFRVRARP